VSFGTALGFLGAFQSRVPGNLVMLYQCNSSPAPISEVSESGAVVDLMNPPLKDTLKVRSHAGRPTSSIVIGICIYIKLSYPLSHYCSTSAIIKSPPRS
jgi:hypothetical protein